jgi:hypothetical protein
LGFFSFYFYLIRFCLSLLIIWFDAHLICNKFVFPILSHHSAVTLDSPIETVTRRKTDVELRKEIEAEEKMVKEQPQKQEVFKKAAWHEQYKV